jgi:glycerol-3-phosphate acyltransferase PlsY
MGKFILFIFISYLLGSISGSLLLGKFKNIDIRKLGSGNAGGTNALRSVGPLFAFGTIFIDILKGYLPIVLFSPYISDINIDIAQITFGVAAVLGHVYPVFYGFKGGKGAGTLVGVVLAIFPYSIPFVFLTWIFILILTGYVGLSTMCAGISLVGVTYLKYSQTLFSEFGYFTIGIAIFLLYTHRENIKRMITGNENQFEKVMIFRRIFKNK